MTDKEIIINLEKCIWEDNGCLACTHCYSIDSYPECDLENENSCKKGSKFDCKYKYEKYEVM